MKHRVVVGIASASLALAVTLAAAGLEELRTICDREAERIEKEAGDGQRRVIARYGGALVSLRKAGSKAGALEAVLALDKEIKRLETEQTLPSSPPQDFPVEAEDTLEKTRAAVQIVAAQKDKKLAELYAKYASRLQALQKQLVAEEELDKAVAVKTEIGRAKFVLADVQSRGVGPREASPSSAATDVPVAEKTDFGKSLILHYSFSRSEGNKVSDSSEVGNNGTAHGAMWTRMGRVGGGYRFDGKDDRIETDRPGLPTDGSDWSVSLWLRPKHDGEDACVLSQYGMGHGRLNVKIEGDGVCRFFYSHRTPVTGACGSLKDGEWNHYLLVNENGTVRSFVNGRHVSDLPGRVGAVMSRRTLFGAIPRHPWCYTGLMDEVMIWNRALSDAEAKELYELAGGK